MLPQRIRGGVLPEGGMRSVRQAMWITGPSAWEALGETDSGGRAPKDALDRAAAKVPSKGARR